MTGSIIISFVSQVILTISSAGFRDLETWFPKAPAADSRLRTVVLLGDSQERKRDVVFFFRKSKLFSRIGNDLSFPGYYFHPVVTHLGWTQSTDWDVITTEGVITNYQDMFTWTGNLPGIS